MDQTPVIKRWHHLDGSETRGQEAARLFKEGRCLTKADLMKVTGLSYSHCQEIVKALVDRGILVADGKIPSAYGRNVKKQIRYRHATTTTGYQVRAATKATTTARVAATAAQREASIAVDAMIAAAIAARDAAQCP